MTSGHRRRRFPWELVGILAIVLIVMVGMSLWFLSPKGQGELVAPDVGSSLRWSDWPTGITEDGLPYVGEPDAAVTIYEFSDFQCPFCADFVHNDLTGLMDEYVASGDARLVWIAVGFDGPESVEAGKAAMCALEQNRFWELHDWLYANQSAIPNSGAFSRERLLAMAVAVGADPDELAACMDDPATDALIRENETYARTQSVDSTPNYLVGDRLIVGADVAALRAVLDDTLQR